MKKSIVLVVALLVAAVLLISCEPQPKAATQEEIATVTALYVGATAAAPLPLEGIEKIENGVRFNDVKYDNKMVLNGEYTITKTDAGNRIDLTLYSGTKLNGVAHSLKVTITEESTTVILDRHKLDGVKL